MEILQKTKDTLVLEALSKAIPYKTYRDLVAQHAANETSTGEDQTEALSEYTQLNNARMKRLDKTLIPSEAVVNSLKNTTKKQTWIVLTESWCGDAAQSMPAMNIIASLVPSIGLKVLLRDENLEVMDAFLTHGGRSIPKLILFDTESQKVVGDWGPRPSEATELVNQYKTDHGALSPEFKKDLQLWYTKDKGQNIFKDLADLIV
ncbi:thioredoxin family protein [Rasiella sp. SM2506]|uniref:thioredoxin family protein n=1 Tax=Rasiella sp. SM2506 TaxID=3423914 RepID=UPI003D7BEBE2